MNEDRFRHNDSHAGQAAALRIDTRLLLMACLVFCSCDFINSNDPKYPPVEKEDLVGCWYETPPTIGNCREQCYSAKGLFYQIGLTDMGTLGIVFSEDSGSYSLYPGGAIGGSNLLVKYKWVSSNKPSEVDSGGGGLEGHTIIRDTLYSIVGGRNNLIQARIRSDSLHTCRPHWRIFSRPPDWDLP